MTTPSFVQVPPDGVGKKIETLEVTTGAGTVEREVVVLADPSDPVGFATVVTATPASNAHGLVVRQAGTVTVTASTWPLPAGAATETTLAAVGSAVSAAGTQAHTDAGTAHTDALALRQYQSLDANNTVTRDSTQGATTFTGAWTRTRSIGVVRILTVLASDVATGLGGTFTFQFSEDGTNPTITEPRTITDFATVRDFDLLNAGEWYRVIWTPSRALVTGEHVFITTTLRGQNDGAFVRLATQPIEELNAAMPQTFAFLQGFDPHTRKSVNVRTDETGALRTADSRIIVSSSGSLFTESIRDDISCIFSRDNYTATVANKVTAVTGQVGTISQGVTDGRAIIGTGAGTNRVAWYRSTKKAVYEPGHEIVGEQTMEAPALTGTAEVRWGYMEDDGATNILNGMGYGLNASGLFLWRMKNGVEVLHITQPSFNRDSMNGQEPSLFRRNGLPVAFQPTMNTLTRVVYEWLGISPPTYKIQSPERSVIEVHVEETSNSQTGTTLPEPSLPLAIRVFSGDMAAGVSVATGSWRGGIHTSKVVGTALNPNLDYSDVRAQGTDTGNCSTTPLAANATFRGLWFPWQASYVKLITDLHSDEPGTLYIDLSEQTSPVDGSDASVDDTIAIAFDPTVTTLLKRQTPIQSRWYRHRYVNGTAGQSAFLLDAALVTADPGLTTQMLAVQPRTLSQGGIVRAVESVGDGTGTAYHDKPVDSSGVPTAHITKIDDDLLLRGLPTTQVRQIVVGTTPVQLDPTKLANRRSAAISNLDESVTPVTLYVGHSAGIAPDNGTFPVYQMSEKGGAYGPNVDLWAVVRNTGGVQSTLARAGSTATGTATNPSNALVSDNIYALMSQGQTVDVSGFTAGTINPLVSVKLCCEAVKQSGQFEQAAFVDVVTGNAGNVGAVATSTSVVAAPLMLYLAYVSRESAATVTGVTGLGLTWTQSISEPSDDAHRTLDLWWAYGSPTANGVVTASFSIAATASHIAVVRVSGADSASPIQDVEVGHANNTAPTTLALTGTNKGLAVMGVAKDNSTQTAGAGYTERSDEVSAAGTIDGLSTETKQLTTTGAETPTATLSQARHWAAVAVAVRPSAAYDPVVTLSYTLSGVAGATSGAITVTSTEVVQKVDITADRTWVFGDAANVHVIATGTGVGGAQADIDFLYLELVDTTANVVRVSLREIA